MKLNKTSSVDEGSTPLRVSHFEIGDHGFVMSMLFEGIYSNPIRSICREIASNARDAHREICTPERSIQITLPTYFDSCIKYKDYGPGISPSRIDDIYTKPGRSTKRVSNTETGGFGLGAKTPFAYTSQFQVLTVTEICTQLDVDVLNLDPDNHYELTDVIGKRILCQYTISRGGADSEQGGGAKLHSVELTEEPTGTEVSIPVKKSDTNTFISEALSTTMYWDPRPCIVGQATFPAMPEEILSGTNWKLTTSIGSSAQITAIIDGIVYPLDFMKIKNQVTYEQQHTFADLNRRSYLQFTFNTGDLELVPNREHILYNEHSIDVIYKAFCILNAELMVIFNAKVSEAESYIDAVKTCMHFTNTVTHPGKMSWKDNTVYYGNSEYQTVVEIINESTAGTKDNRSARLDSYSFSSSKRSGDKEYYKTNKLGMNPFQKLIINDVGSHVSQAYISEFIAIHGKKSFQVLTALDANMPALLQRIKTVKCLDINALNPLRLSGFKPSVERVASTKKERAPQQRGTMLVRMFNSGEWFPERIDTKNGSGIWVKLIGRSRDMMIDNQVMDSYKLDYIKKAIDFGNKKLYALAATDDEQKLGPGFVSLESLVKAEKEKYEFTEAEIQEYKAIEKVKKNFSSVHSLMMLNLPNLDFSRIKNLEEKHKKLANKLHLGNAVFNIHVDLSIDLQYELDINIELGYWEKYPLLRFINLDQARHNDKAKVEIGKYIEFVNLKDCDAKSQDSIELRKVS